MARSIHALSPRAEEALVEVNCAAIPEDMIESELFGHRKGSFTGAQEDKVGKFQKAHGGTLFLDEVGDMSLKTQAKVLRSLDEQRFEPVGASESIQVDVRVVAATNKNLEEEIERGNFREDLFYRLNVIPFYVPPLRDRREDIPLLAEYFLHEFTTAYGRKAKELTPEAYRLLEEYYWPGNVRELRNMMERIVIMNPQVRIDARHIPLNVPKKAAVARSIDRFASLAEVRETGRARVYPQEARRNQGQRVADGGIARPGAQQSVPQDEGARHRAEGVIVVRVLSAPAQAWRLAERRPTNIRKNRSASTPTATSAFGTWACTSEFGERLRSVLTGGPVRSLAAHRLSGSEFASGLDSDEVPPNTEQRTIDGRRNSKWVVHCPSIQPSPASALQIVSGNLRCRLAHCTAAPREFSRVCVSQNALAVTSSPTIVSRMPEPKTSFSSGSTCTC